MCSKDKRGLKSGKMVWCFATFGYVFQVHAINVTVTYCYANPFLEVRTPESVSPTSGKLPVRCTRARAKHLVLT